MLKFPFAVICEACGAQTVIFISSMVSSAVICPMLGVYRDHVISMLTALGAACLAGDAIFHLIPHVSDATYKLQFSFRLSSIDEAHARNHKHCNKWNVNKIMRTR